ncbi:hypothetical protein V6N11_078842 [Hibiscus sabdariffa]|uniref:Bet v I/Major latex protein domain-containing protein n=1 Tax=Hibiscus sabdariffa TaxID=183260 RepID=A0ABR2RU49_9ROSI
MSVVMVVNVPEQQKISVDRLEEQCSQSPMMEECYPNGGDMLFESWRWSNLRIHHFYELGKLLNQLFRDVIGTVEVVYGDGGVGTILKFTFPPGRTPGSSYTKEVFTRIDDEQRSEEGEIFEGGLKYVGFEVYRQSSQTIEKDAQSSIIRSTVEYEINDELHELAFLATTKPMETLNEAVGKYLKQNWDPSNNH